MGDLYSEASLKRRWGRHQAILFNLHEQATTIKKVWETVQSGGFGFYVGPSIEHGTSYSHRIALMRSRFGSLY